MISSKDIVKMAEAEVIAETYRRMVDEEKVRIRTRCNYWFPWRIRIRFINLNKETKS